ncbi:SH3 domain-binding protein 1 isoform X1 [Phyllopteryx taeniolatus]|uniref:SH3 domain-binding protein 1 isoform X1 n=2 Tax=Phyllopteryx taeniolatus TaxID=161469 RepID=UPI002AD4BD78|nr:SH3 domain-binding protein 1 isoform X1 [Phyllopteryx taeniolatus]
MLRQSLSILKQLGSSGKSQDVSELLHADLVVVEQRVEPAKRAAQMLHKKLQGCMQSQTGPDAERRMKKLPLMLLSISMAESFKDFDADSSIRKVLEMCCFMEKKLASLLADFEIKVEKEVLEPLNKLGEEELPEVLKNKKHFAKLHTDWNNARLRSQGSTGPQAKQDGLKEEEEEALRKLEIIKNQYSADLYHFATKEDDYASYFIRLLELQAEYHKNSHEFLDKNINELKENHSQKGPPANPFGPKVFGEPLASHLLQSNREIAAPIQECVHMLLRTGMREEGLFRLTAAASVVKRLKTCMDQGTVDHSEFRMDPHAVAGALKCYLRELPEPLLTFELYKDWFKAAGEKDCTEKLEQFRILLKKLPPENYNNLRYLVQFLSLLSEHQAANKMTPGNIAIVLGPNLLWPQAEGEITLVDMASASSVQVVTVIEPLIQYSAVLFPEEISFEIPGLPKVQDDRSKISEQAPLSRRVSTSSTASSSSIYHLPCSKTSSVSSEDSVSVTAVKSERRQAWAASGHEAATTTQKDTATLSSSPTARTSLLPIQNPIPHPRTAGSNPGHSRDPVQKQCSEQLEPISEPPPVSPKAVVTISTPNKPKRSISVRKANETSEPLTVHYSKTKAPVPPKPRAPPAPAATDGNQVTRPPPPTRPVGLKKPPIKKSGLKAPSCPPPLPPALLSKQAPSIAQ